jgi:hypothetical protein
MKLKHRNQIKPPITLRRLISILLRLSLEGREEHETSYSRYASRKVAYRQFRVFGFAATLETLQILQISFVTPGKRGGLCLQSLDPEVDEALQAYENHHSFAWNRDQLPWPRQGT